MKISLVMKTRDKLLSLSDQNHQKKSTPKSRLASNFSQEKDKVLSLCFLITEGEEGRRETPSFPLICSCTDLFLIEMKFPVKKAIQRFWSRHFLPALQALDGRKHGLEVELFSGGTQSTDSKRRLMSICEWSWAVHQLICWRMIISATDLPNAFPSAAKGPLPAEKMPISQMKGHALEDAGFQSQPLLPTRCHQLAEPCLVSH